VLEGRTILAHCAGFTGLVFIQINLAQNRHRVALFQMGNDFALETSLAAALMLAATSAGPGTSATVGSLMALAGAAALCFLILCLTGAALWAGSTAGAGVVGAGATAGNGAGMGGSVFVLFCATALSRSLRPRSTSNSFS